MELRSLLIGDYDVILTDGNVQRGRFYSLSALNKLFRKCGVSAQWPTYDLREPRVPDNADKLHGMLKRTSAVFAPGACGIFDNDSLVDSLNGRLTEGLRIWITVPQIPKANVDDRSSRLRRFLEHHGIRPTMAGVFCAASEFDHPRSFLVRRDDYAEGFCHPQLFRGVDRLLFQQAHGMLLQGEAFSTAFIRPGDYEIVDMDTDLFTAWNAPHISLIATTHVGTNGGCIVCTSGLVVSDPYEGPLGHSFPGLEQNAPIIRNIVQMLLQSTLSKEPTTEVEIHALIQNIERNLLEAIRRVLSRGGVEWTEFVTETAKEKAQLRARSEGGKLPCQPISIWWII